MVMKIKNIFKKSSECKNTSKEKGSRKEVNDPQGLLGINKEPNYNNFLALFTVDNSPWDFYDKVGINIENDGFYFLHFLFYYILYIQANNANLYLYQLDGALMVDYLN